MPLLSLLARLFFLRRLFNRSRRGGHGYGYGGGYGRRPRGYGRGRGRGGFGLFGPFPTYSRRTRGGGRVSVSGCCLPIPLGIFTALAAGALRVRGTRR